MAHWTFRDPHRRIRTADRRASMASTAPRLPEQYQPRSQSSGDDDFAVSELVSDAAGAHSPFGETVFPMPVNELDYIHPSPENLPNLLPVPGND
jgi:hypothetical protein